MGSRLVRSLPVWLLAATAFAPARPQDSANSTGMCSRIAQIRQDSTTGFKRLRGELFSRNADSDVYEATMALTGSSNDFIYVSHSPDSSPFYSHFSKYREGTTAEEARKFLPLMRRAVEQCYGNDVSISCADSRCSAISLSKPRELVFTWSSAGIQHSTFNILQSRPLPADAKWLAAAPVGASAIPALPRNELLEACSQTHHDWATKNGYSDWPDSKIARWCGCISRNLAPAMTAQERQQFIADTPAFVDKVLDDPPPGQQRNWRLYSPLGTCQH